MEENKAGYALVKLWRGMSTGRRGEECVKRWMEGEKHALDAELPGKEPQHTPQNPLGCPGGFSTALLQAGWLVLPAPWGWQPLPLPGQGKGMRREGLLAKTSRATQSLFPPTLLSLRIQ